MTKKIILTLGSVILLASSLSAGSIGYERDNNHRDYQKSNKHIKRDNHRDSRYLSRAEQREIIRMREIKRERMEARERRLEETRRMEARERRLEERRVEARIREHEVNKIVAIVNLATLPILIHDMHMRELAMVRDRY